MRRFLLFLFLVLLIDSVYALKISGRECCLFRQDFIPNFTQSNDYFVTNAEGYEANYEIEIKRIKGADLREYFAVIPSKMDNVMDSESRPFTVKVNLPKETPDVPGESETWVRVIVTPAEGITGITAVPSLVIRYIYFVLYPYKFINFEFSTPSMNINETKDFAININNLGEPTINSVRANLTITDSSGNIIRRMNTDSEFGVISRETRKLSSSFSSNGLNAGNYKAFATVAWDSNSSEMENDFRIGTKEVTVKDTTKKFEADSINKMYIEVGSNWNSEIRDIYADVSILDEGKKVKQFKSLNSNLMQFETKRLDAYFDTNELGKKEYLMKIELNYDGVKSYYEDTVMVDENVNGEVVEEMPNSFNISAFLTPINLMIFFVLIFLVVNAFLLLKMGKKRKEDDIDPAVLDKVRELKKTYNDDHIKDMMVAKGWEEKKIYQILRKLK